MSEGPNSRFKEIQARIKRVRDGIRITKITATRAVKGRNGDSFCGFSASWQSVQDDYGGAGADLHGDMQEDKVAASQGLSLSDARIARYILAKEADTAALESAYANGGITEEYFRDALKAMRSNYQQLVLRELTEDQKTVFREAGDDST